MSLLSSIGLWVGGLLAGFALGSYAESRRRSSATEDRDMGGRIVETEDGGVMWIGPRDPRTADAASTLNADASGQTISGTWSSVTEGSLSEYSIAPSSGRDGPHGFRGEDLTDREVEEWLRDHGLKGYD